MAVRQADGAGTGERPQDTPRARAAGFVDTRDIPTLAGFQIDFIKAIETRSTKPKTIAFYKDRYNRLLKFPALANARLDRIDEKLVETFIQDHEANVARATINRSLATLRRALRLAEEWKILPRAPRIRLLSGENAKEYVLSRPLEPVYLAACPEPLHDVAVLILNTGLRLGEALSLAWADVHVEPLGGANLGHISIRKGKSKNAVRSVPLTDAAPLCWPRAGRRPQAPGYSPEIIRASGSQTEMNPS